MSKFLDDLEAPFIRLFNDVKAEVQKELPLIESLATNFVSGAVAAIEKVFEIGAPIAIQAILAEAPKLLSGTEKFGNAVTHVAQQLEVHIGPVAMGDVQALVQTAYRGIQAIAVSKE